MLEQEGQVTYLPRRGYFVTELRSDDLEEIYELRRVLEERAARATRCRLLDEDALERIELAARDCVDAAERGDVAAELERQPPLSLRASSSRPTRSTRCG